MIYLLVVLIVGAPSILIDSAYTSYSQCEAIARPLNDGNVRAVCQSIRVAL